MESIIFLILMWVLSGAFGKDKDKKKQAPPPRPVFRDEDAAPRPVRMPKRTEGPAERMWTQSRRGEEERPEPLSYEQQRERQQALKRHLQQKHAGKAAENGSITGPTPIQQELQQRQAAGRQQTAAPVTMMPPRPDTKAWPKDHDPHEGYCEIDEDVFIEGAAASLPDTEAPALLEPRDFNPRSLVAAVIMKEVLDKPLALRENRR